VSELREHAVASTREAAPTEADAWAALAQVLDPEVPVLSVLELGIVRGLRIDRDQVHVIVTPTYSGCPALDAIQDSIRSALLAEGAREVHIELQFAPAWTTDWIAPEAAEKLRRYGIAPPHAASLPAHAVAPSEVGGPVSAAAPVITRPLRFQPRDVPCPRCGAASTERLSAFGSTACKALYRCLSCREPFEYFKPL